MFFNKKKKETEKLLTSFGELKDDAFNFDLIDKYFRKKDDAEAFQVLTDKTCNDIDFNELFKHFDRTNSKIGQQYLYKKLRTVPSSSKNTDRNERLIEYFTSDSDSRVSIQKQLKRLNNYNTYFLSKLFLDEHLKPPKWFFVIKLLSFSSILSVVLLPVNPQLLVVLLAVFIVNIVIHLWNKRILFKYMYSIPQLFVLIKVARVLFQNEQLKTINPELQKSLSAVAKIKDKMSFFKLEARQEGPLDFIILGFFELFKIVFLIEPLLLFRVLKQLDTKREEIENVFDFVGEIDALISIASLRKGLAYYCCPLVVDTTKTLATEKVYHPLIFNCVGNSLKIEDKSVLLTGSNMSGKTSFIRTVGINVITGLTINTCFAKQFSMARMKVFSAIRISDDLLNDKSYYFEEVLTIKEMVNRGEDDKPGLFLLDEIFKGTNTVERISAGKAVLAALGKGNNLVFVSTHDIELAELLNDRYDLYHFCEQVDNKSVDFDYKLKNGKLRTRNAIKILQLNNYPEEIINEAKRCSEEIERAHVIS